MDPPKPSTTSTVAEHAVSTSTEKKTSKRVETAAAETKAQLSDINA